MTRRPVEPRMVLVDGVEFTWSLRHGWLVDQGKGLKGISISVRRLPGDTRELVIDFDFAVFSRGRPKEALLRRHLEIAIRSALGSGWDPESRGKPFRHRVSS